jgi:dTDP-4-amino-4,6-dideoxygalactose transaminase
VVPLFDIRLQHQAIQAELVATFQRVLHSGHFILGPEVQAFELNAAKFLRVRHALGVSSGTDAILLALMSLGIGPGDEVICPSFTFFATAGCIARVGAIPVFADCCPACFNLDVADAAERITGRTKAIIPVHLFGQSAEMDSVMALAEQHNLAVVEDAAQAIGAEYRGRQVGGIGNFGAFSFFPTKNLGALGDAGLLVTNDDALAERARLLRTHGARQRYFHESVGGNFRLDAIQAALLNTKLQYHDLYTARRRAHAAFYAERLGALPGVVRTEVEGGACSGEMQSTGSARARHRIELNRSVRIILPAAYPHNRPIWNQYTLRVLGDGCRDALKQHLAARGIGSEIYYPIPLHRQPCFARSEAAAQKLPVSDTIASQCLSIPVFPELTEEQRDEVVSGIQSFLESMPADGGRSLTGSATA